ncbi:hypothetical protein AB0H40_36345 [Streptomyces filamentosus]
MDGSVYLDIGEGQDGSVVLRGTVGADVAFHGHPSGDVLFALTVEAFGYAPEESFVEWSGRYLSEDTAIITLGGESQDEEKWFRHHLVDVRTGTLSGEFTTEAGNPYELVPLGDGS